MAEFQDFEGRLAQIDFGVLKRRLSMDPVGRHWDARFVASVVDWYKRFLFLCGEFPDHSLSVIKEIDVVWHLHILDTERYFSDCEVLFGRYLHHRPMEENGDGSDIAASIRLIETTMDRFRAYFGEDPIAALHGGTVYGTVEDMVARCSSCVSPRISPEGAVTGV
jgi:hypothetical protein